MKVPEAALKYFVCNPAISLRMRSKSLSVLAVAYSVPESIFGEIMSKVVWSRSFKKQKSLLHEFDRLDMVEKAIQDNYKLKTSDIEFHLPKPSYTIDTLTVLQEKYPEHEFGLIMGGDNLGHFKK